MKWVKSSQTDEKKDQVRYQLRYIQKNGTQRYYFFYEIANKFLKIIIFARIRRTYYDNNEIWRDVRGDCRAYQARGRTCHGRK